MPDAITKPQFRNKNIEDHTLLELTTIDAELEKQEQNFLEAMQHSKFEKFSPKPEMNKTFRELRDNIKKEIEVKKNEN